MGYTNFPDGVDAALLKLAGVAVTATAAQINAAATGSGSTANSTAAPAAAGNSQGTGTAMTADFNAVTAADGTKGVVLPTASATTVITVINTDASAVLKVYPATGAQINALGANAAISVGPGRLAVFVGRSATLWYCAGESAISATAAALSAAAQGVAAGYKVARGETALDGSNPTPVAHGLTTCVAFTATLKGTAAPGVGTSVLTANINGANVDVYAWKPTSNADPTLVASTGTESFYWTAVGT